MPTVTVDIEDLQSLLFATSAIGDLEKASKQVGAALDQRQRNPIVTGTTRTLQGAHDRLSTAWRRAQRERDWPARVISEADMAALRAMFTGPDGALRSYVILDEYPRHFVQDLLLVESGPCWAGHQIAWPSPAEPEFCIGQADARQRYGARLSFYGRQVLGVTDEELVRPDHVVGGGLLATATTGLPTGSGNGVVIGAYTRQGMKPFPMKGLPDCATPTPVSYGLDEESYRLREYRRWQEEVRTKGAAAGNWSGPVPRVPEKPERY